MVWEYFDRQSFRPFSDDGIDPRLLWRHPNVEDVNFGIIEEPLSHLTSPATDYSSGQYGDENALNTSGFDSRWSSPNVSSQDGLESDHSGMDLENPADVELRLPDLGLLDALKNQRFHQSLVFSSLEPVIATSVSQSPNMALPASHQYYPIFQDCTMPRAPDYQRVSQSRHHKRREPRKTKGRKKKSPEELARNKRKVSKPEKCVKCGKGHADQRDLERHLVAAHRSFAESIGLDVSKVKCQDCGEEFDNIRRDRLRRHMKRKHKVPY